MATVSMLTQRVIGLIAGAVIAFCPVSRIAAQSGAGLDELQRAIDGGQQVKFRFKFNSVAPDGQRSSGIYRCCGMPAVYMADGTALITNSAITFQFSVAVKDFTVAPEKILEFSSQPTQGSRVHLLVSIPNGKGNKEDKKNYYLYNPAVVGMGDPSVGGPGASITCGGCDNSMEVLADLVAWIRTPNHSMAGAGTVSPSKAAGSLGAGMTNGDVVKLAAAGLSDQVIATAIRQERATSFDLSPSALIALKNSHVPNAAIAAMQEKNAEALSGPPGDFRTPSKDGGVLANPAPTGVPPAAPLNPCTGIEMMGLYKVDMRPVMPLVVYQAKVRNGTSLTRIVTVGWQDFYGQEKVVRGQVSPGDIGTFELGRQQLTNRQPINLRVKSCE
jgi:hypothetical protein